MATKLSQISPGATPLPSDQIVGIHAGTTDNLFSISQLQNSMMAGSNPFTFDSRSVATTNTIPPLPQARVIETRGYANPGDGGAALYSRASGSTPGGFQSADGQWWQPIGLKFNVRQFGAVGDGVTVDDAAFLAAINACVGAQPNGPNTAAALFLPSGNY